VGFRASEAGISIAQAKAEMEPLFLHTQQWIPAQIRQDFHLRSVPVRDRQMQEAYLGAWVLLGSVLAVLVIVAPMSSACFSARAAARERELAVRTALRSHQRQDLVRQALTELSSSPSLELSQAVHWPRYSCISSSLSRRQVFRF